MIRYLSLDWLDALSAEVAASADLQRLAGEHTIGVTQVVTDGPEGNVLYHLQLSDGTAASSGAPCSGATDGAASFGPGQAFPEDVRMEQAWDTAIGIATGQMNAQEAFIKGRILLTGDQTALLAAQPVFGALDTVFRSVGERTTYS